MKNVANPTAYNAVNGTVRPDKNALIEMRDVVKIFHTTAGDFTALNGINVNFYEGEFVSVVGKSGSGKSTLANMITGIDHPTEGSVRIAGTELHTMSESVMSSWRGRNLGIVFQFFQLLPMLSLVENVMLPMDFCNVYEPAERYDKALALLDMVGLKDYAEALPAAISGGQQQSTAIARALANDPPVIIADEPTGSLDSRTAEAVFGIFQDLAQRGKTIVMVTHDRSLASRTDRILLISDGNLIDEFVTAAFPALPHKDLLHISQQMETRRLEPGQPLIGAEMDQPGLVVVSAGEINGGPADETGIVCFPPGKYISELELKVEGSRKAMFKTPRPALAGWVFKAGPEGAEVLWAGPEPFSQWLSSSDLVNKLLNEAAVERVARWKNGLSYGRSAEVSES